MISDIGPGMRMLIDRLEAHEGDYQEQLPLPNGYIASIIRTAKIEVPVPEALRGLIDEGSVNVGGSYGVDQGLFEMALINPLMDRITNVEGYMTPVDCARKLREWFELPEARGFRDASED